MNRDFLPFAIPDIGETEVEMVRETLLSGWLTTGQRTASFERAFAEAVGAKHAVAVNSCTAALHLALEAIDLAAGDEVITSPYTFAATGEVVQYFGARPVFVDVDAETLNLRADLIEENVTERTRAILPVHIAGLPADMDPILEIARRRDLFVIEDAAHAFPAAYRDRPIGSVGDITCFSFYATKTITTGEGGMVCTDDEEWHERCRMMSLHGITRDAWSRYAEDGHWYYEILKPGYKYNLTDIAAAIGAAQLTKSDGMWRRRRSIARRYNEAFGDESALQIPRDSAADRHAWHLYMLRIDEDALTIDRAEFVRRLGERGIGTSVHFIPLHMHPWYRATYGYEPDDFPVAHREYRREISLPIYSRMSDEDVETVVRAVIDVVREHRRSATVGVP